MAQRVPGEGDADRWRCAGQSGSCHVRRKSERKVLIWKVRTNPEDSISRTPISRFQTERGRISNLFPTHVGTATPDFLQDLRRTHASTRRLFVVAFVAVAAAAVVVAAAAVVAVVVSKTPAQYAQTICQRPVTSPLAGGLGIPNSGP